MSKEKNEEKSKIKNHALKNSFTEENTLKNKSIGSDYTKEIRVKKAVLKQYITALFIFGLLFFNPLFAHAKAEHTLRYANFPPATTIPSVQMDMWVESIQERTHGKLAIQTFPASTLLDTKAMLRGVAYGQADIGCTSMLYYPGSFPLFELFGLPLGFKSAAEASYVAWEIFKAHTPKELARYKVLALFASAPSQIMSSQPVYNLSDVQKITLRSAGSISDGLEAIQANAVSIPMSDTPEALQKGIVDGVCSSWDTLKDMSYAESCAYGLTVNMPVYPFVVLMNKQSWEKLPKEIQENIDSYADEHVRLTGAYIDKAGADALNWAKTQHDFSLSTLSDAEMQEINKAVQPLIQEWKEHALDKGLDADTILKDIEKFRAQFTAMQK